MEEWREHSKSDHKRRAKETDTVVVRELYVLRSKTLSGKPAFGRRKLFGCTGGDQVDHRMRKEVPMIQEYSRNQRVSTEEIRNVLIHDFN